MATKPIEKDTHAFVTGNEVVAWAALAADAQIMYGYPITPQNEIMHYWTRLAPKYDRKFLQTEDELSAGFTTCGRYPFVYCHCRARHYFDAGADYHGRNDAHSHCRRGSTARRSVHSDGHLFPTRSENVLLWRER